MARKPLPGTPINLPIVKAGPETHPPRTAVSAPRGPIPGTPINLPVRRDSTIRPASADLDTVAEGAGLSQGSPDSLDRVLDEASDRDIDSAEFSVLWPSASEDEADRRFPRSQHSEASSSQQVVQQVTADEHGAEAGWHWQSGLHARRESGARGQEAGSALAGIKMTQRREKLISHALSRILRHEAQDHDLPMNSAGYVPILDLVTVQSLWNHQVSPAEVHHAAQINKKQRFEIQTVKWGGVY
eukprot:s6584_g2.t1